MSRSSEMVEEAAVEEEMGGVGKQRGAHTSTTIFLCISRPPTTCRQTAFPLMQLKKTTEFPNQSIKMGLSGRNVLIRDKCLNGLLYRRLYNLTVKFTWKGCCIMTESTTEQVYFQKHPDEPTPTILYSIFNKAKTMNDYYAVNGE